MEEVLGSRGQGFIVVVRVEAQEGSDSRRLSTTRTSRALKRSPGGSRRRGGYEGRLPFVRGRNEAEEPICLLMSGCGRIVRAHQA